MFFTLLVPHAAGIHILFCEYDHHRAATNFAVVVHLSRHFIGMRDGDFEDFETSRTGNFCKFHACRLTANRKAATPKYNREESFLLRKPSTPNGKLIFSFFRKFTHFHLHRSAECLSFVRSQPNNTMAYESDSCLKFYLREISKTPLLTIAEETELAERIKMGDEAARTQMIQANLRLVVKIAQDYSGYGLSLSDLISEGNIGLMHAVERFDPEKGGKLSTYGAWWIKQSIKRALANQSKTIRLPIHMVDKIARMRRIASSLAESLGREPTDDELAEELGLPRQKIAMLKQASQRPTSLDAPINESDATEYGEVISDENATSPLDALSDKNLYGEISGLLSILNERERRIIDERFGLNGLKPMLLEDVGREFGVSRERIRQLQNSALEKMRKALMKKDKPAPQPLDKGMANI